jgi:hypothetical protein
MSYDPGKISKLLDNLEETATDWMENQVKEFYSVDDTDNLSKDQVLEIHQYKNSEECDPMIGLALGNLINSWEMENDEELDAPW